MATKFNKNDAVKFERNSIDKQDVSVVSAVIEKSTDTFEEQQRYIIEYENGWQPNSIRVNLYGLDPAKKYLFASELELTAIV